MHFLILEKWQHIFTSSPNLFRTSSNFCITTPWAGEDIEDNIWNSQRICSDERDQSNKNIKVRILYLDFRFLPWYPLLLYVNTVGVSSTAGHQSRLTGPAASSGNPDFSDRADMIDQTSAGNTDIDLADHTSAQYRSCHPDLLSMRLPAWQTMQITGRPRFGCLINQEDYGVNINFQQLLCQSHWVRSMIIYLISTIGFQLSACGLPLEIHYCLGLVALHE